MVYAQVQYRVFFVIDVDGEAGEESLAELEREYGKLPETVEQVTGAGRHILFRYPENLDIRPKAGIMRGLDIRGNEAYIVVAPSVHPSGQRYRWEAAHHPLKTQIAEAPGWLLKLLVGNTSPNQNNPAATTNNEWAELLGSLDEGQRNNNLYRYACHLLAHGLGAVETVKIIRALNEMYGNPPLSDDEVDKLLQSAIKWRFEE